MKKIVICLFVMMVFGTQLAASNEVGYHELVVQIAASHPEEFLKFSPEQMIEVVRAVRQRLGNEAAEFIIQNYLKASGKVLRENGRR